jgi:predicted ATPase
MYKSEIRESQLAALLQKAESRDYLRYLPKLLLKHVRGFVDEPITFDFPVTAIIGPNGGGKTTILGAAACAYKSVAPRRFFAKSGLYDETMQNWEIEYEIIDRDVNSKDVIHRTASFKSLRWKREAMNRQTMVFGVNRTVPANERAELLRCATSRFTVPNDRIDDIPNEVAKAVAKVLGKDISGFRRLKIDSNNRYIFLTGKTKDGHGFSEFHFGAGESSVIRMISQIERAEDYSLILIEEIENGLHPVATVRMVEYLIDVAHRKKVQTIFTTHSNDALRPLPPKAVWVATQEKIYQGKLDIHSLRAITGEISARLAIFVEDAFAKAWVEAILRHSGGIAIDHILVFPMEGDGTATKFNSHNNENPACSVPSICIVDGDSKQKESAEKRIYRLPGTVPELYVFEQVMAQWTAFGGKLAVALLQRFEQAGAVKATLDSVHLTNRDHHLIFAQVGEKLGLVPESTVIAAFANIWAQAYPLECVGLVGQLGNLVPREDTHAQ